MNWRREDGETTVVGVLIMPTLALALGLVLHLGLYLMARQATITAVQQGLTSATATDTSPGQGEAVARELIERHSAAEVLTVDTSSTANTLTMTATVRAPGLVPGLQHNRRKIPVRLKRAKKVQQNRL